MCDFHEFTIKEHVPGFENAICRPREDGDPPPSIERFSIGGPTRITDAFGSVNAPNAPNAPNVSGIRRAFGGSGSGSGSGPSVSASNQSSALGVSVGGRSQLGDPPPGVVLPGGGPPMSGPPSMGGPPSIGGGPPSIGGGPPPSIGGGPTTGGGALSPPNAPRL